MTMRQMGFHKWLGLASAAIAGIGATSVLAQRPTFDEWHNPAGVDRALDYFQTTYPTLAQKVEIGRSLEGKPIYALKISDNVSIDDLTEGDVVFAGAHHAREWLSVETTLYIADQILANYSSDAALQEDVNGLEIWIIPVVNVDGFVYSWSTDRSWRKNMKRTADDTLYGVDLNRNYSFQWGLDSGSSSSRTHDAYRGTMPLSEPETVVMIDFLSARQNLEALVSYHAYSELYLRPWAYSRDNPPGEETVMQVARRDIRRIDAVHGHEYAETISYLASGEFTDFVWETYRIAAFTPEIRPTMPVAAIYQMMGGGLDGFNPPTSEIVPNIEENYAAARALIHDAGDREVWIRDYPGDDGTEPSAIWIEGTGWSEAYWHSPDITTSPEELTEGATAQMSVHVHNDSGVTKDNVRVDTYITDPSISLEFPNPVATRIDTRMISVPPGGRTITFDWNVPEGANSWGQYHWCVGAIVYHEDDMPLTTQAQKSSNVAIRNLWTERRTMDDSGGEMMMMAATNFLDVPTELLIHIDRDSLPAGWTATVATPPARAITDRINLTTMERKAKLLGATGPLLAPGETVYLPVRVKAPPGAPEGATADINISGGLKPLVAGEREVVGNGFTFRVKKADCNC